MADNSMARNWTWITNAGAHVADVRGLASKLHEDDMLAPRRQQLTEDHDS